MEMNGSRWPEQFVRSWSHAETYLGEAGALNASGHVYLFRGQSDATWSLTPSLLRYFDPPRRAADLLKLENVAFKRFKAQAHLHLGGSIAPSDFSAEGFYGEWWALMQHHHAPTRLLDWTWSPYVALYFAVERDWDRNGAVYLIHLDVLDRSFKVNYEGTVHNHHLDDPAAKPGIMAWMPAKHTERVIAQQGAFTFNINIADDHETPLTQAGEELQREAPGQLLYRKIIVEASAKPQLLARLRSMNITAQALFPGLDGLGRGIGELARLSRHTAVERLSQSEKLESDQSGSPATGA